MESWRPETKSQFLQQAHIGVVSDRRFQRHSCIGGRPMTNSSGVLTTVKVCPGDDFRAAPSFPLIAPAGYGCDLAAAPGFVDPHVAGVVRVRPLHFTPVTQSFAHHHQASLARQPQASRGRLGFVHRRPSDGPDTRRIALADWSPGGSVSLSCSGRSQDTRLLARRRQIVQACCLSGCKVEF